MSRAVGTAAFFVLSLAAPSSGVAQSSLPPDKLLDILVAAYPNFLERHDGIALIWKDGTRTPLDDGRAAKDIEALFAAPSLRDMFHWTYPRTLSAGGPPSLSDPGRIRVEAFFNRMYGDCTKGEVTQHLVNVAWLPKKGGGTLKATRVNGVADKLQAVSAELDDLPAAFDKYLMPAAGTYYCRPIAGTNRLSAHGSGTAIDISTAHAHYWRWTKPAADSSYPWRNSVPPEIVRIFERHGFIWGGKWYHYDTMHFEYRPEMLAASQ